MAVLAAKNKSYGSLDEYFDFLANTMGVPNLHQEFEHAEVISDGLKLHLDILEFSKTAPTVVFVPGTAIYAMCYAEFLYKLGELGFNIVGLDPRGHGRSEGLRGDYSISELMNDVNATIDYAIKRFGDNISLIGSSQGGIVSFYLAAKDNRLKSVVCQNFADLTSPASAQLTRFPRLTNYIKPVLLKFGSVAPTTQIPVSIYLDLEQIKIKYFGNAKKFMDMDPLALQSVSFRALSSLASTPITKPIEEISTPVMVFQGTHDSIFPVSYTRDIFDKLTCKKRFRLFEGLDHAIMVEDADVILHPIADWLKEVH